MTSYAILIRKRCYHKNILFDASKSEVIASKAALIAYWRLKLDRVVVIRIEGEEKEIVYLQERNCKHDNVQMELTLKGNLVFVCQGCGEHIEPLNTCITCGKPMIAKNGFYTCGNIECIDYDKDIYDAPVPVLQEVGVV